MVFEEPLGRKKSEGQIKNSGIVPVIIVFAALIIPLSCAHHETEHYSASVQNYSIDDIERTPPSRDIREQLYGEYLNWKGTQYRYGGTARNGIDCSGFVSAVYENIFDIHLPRTTKALARVGKPVKKPALRAGDLVFFKLPSYPRHVGIYLGDDEFVHASKTAGVIISKINRHYWSKYYWTARRVLLPQ
jgi:lipoprotein Spr